MTETAIKKIDSFFSITERGSSIKTEATAGLTTFLAMAYIIFVNPSILGATGMDTGAVFVATALAAAIGTLVMGLWARYPIAQAPGMGLNAFFAFTVVLGMGIDWQTALAATFVSGLLFLVLALTGVRNIIISAIPKQLKLAVGAGIGLFIAFIGLKNSGIIVQDDATYVGLGQLTSAGPMLAFVGIIITAILVVKGFRGAVFYGIVATSIIGLIFSVVSAPSALVSAAPSLAPTFGEAIVRLPDLLSFELIIVVVTMLFVDFFDTAGTLIAVTNQANLLDEDGNLPKANQALASDSIATMSGAVLGTSTTTSYIESAAGVGAGGRTGLTSVFTSLLFVVSIFFSPLLVMITAEVTAPALIIVGVMMAKGLKEIEWDKMEYAIPAFLTVIAMPLTFSIATGIAMGLLLFPILMAFKGRFKEVSPIMYGLAVLFASYFIWLAE